MKYIFPTILLLLALLTHACVDPVPPAYEFETNFLLIEGQILDQPELSEVRITRSEVFLDAYTLVPVEGLTVSSIDGDGNEISWARIDETSSYQPPADFAAQTGQSYYLRVLTSDGKVIESTPEIAPVPVPITEAELRFEQEAYFSQNRNRFVPAFRLLVDIQDPGDQNNFYQWKFRSFQFLDVCASCRRSVYRNGQCVETPGSRFVERFDYLCDLPCWAERKGATFNILSDEFSQGQRIENVETGRIDFDSNGGLLVEVQQFNITRAQYDYNVVLKDLAEGSGGLNSTLPATLIGNLREVGNPGQNILGFVGTASIDTRRIYIDRDTVNGQPLPFDASIRLEPGPPNPPAAPCTGSNRTTIRPIGWPE